MAVIVLHLTFFWTCVLPWTVVSPNLSKNQLGRVGFHSEICESSLPVFQGWIALGRMEPIVGCWVHPTSTTQTLTQWTSTWHHMWVEQAQEKSWHGIQNNVKTNCQDNLTAILYKTDDIRLEQQDIVEPAPDQVCGQPCIIVLHFD